MRKITIIVGRAATGKTSLEKLLEEKYDFLSLISHTTRPQREGEEYGIDYYFTDIEHMEDMINGERVLEQISYLVDGEHWFYALTKEEVVDKLRMNKQLVVTMNPPGISQMIDHEDLLDDMVVLYLSGDRLEERYLHREGNTEGTQERWNQRHEQDEIDFDWFEKTVIPELRLKGVPVIGYENAFVDSRRIEDDVLQAIVDIINAVAAK